MLEPLSNLATKILDKLTDFFDVFDLSFFVSGAMVLAGVALLINDLKLDEPPIQGGVERFGAAVLGCYLLGLMSSAAGRMVRSRITRTKGDSFAKSIDSALSHHNLYKFEPFKQYKKVLEVGAADSSEQNAYAGALYTRLWVEIRENRQGMDASYSLLRRYWVLCATYDGMAAALVFWSFLALWIGGSAYLSTMDIPTLVLMLGLAIVLVFIATACSREARRLKSTQIEEVTACVAYLVLNRKDVSGSPLRRPSQGPSSSFSGGVASNDGGPKAISSGGMTAVAVSELPLSEEKPPRA